MTEKEVLQELESLGTEQHRKVYGRHGVGDNVFGVSCAELGKLKKRIKVDHDLAQKLWESWAKGLSNYVLTDAFSTFAGQTPLAQKKAEKWMKAKSE